jgi:succinate dehydrogenase hydrophobic anchor subunit
MPYYFVKSGRGNNLAAALVGVLDMIAGLVIYLSLTWDFAFNSIILFLSFFYFCLGIWSLLTNLLKKNYFDWRGMIDIVNATCLVLIFSGSVFDVFKFFGVVVALKGVLGLFLITTSERS